MSTEKKNVFDLDRGIIPVALPLDHPLVATRVLEDGRTVAVMEESKLDKRLSMIDHANAEIHVVRCYLPGTETLVHESRHAEMKAGIGMAVEAGQIG